MFLFVCVCVCVEKLPNDSRHQEFMSQLNDDNRIWFELFPNILNLMKVTFLSPLLGGRKNPWDGRVKRFHFPFSENGASRVVARPLPVRETRTRTRTRRVLVVVVCEVTLLPGVVMSALVAS